MTESRRREVRGWAGSSAMATWDAGSYETLTGDIYQVDGTEFADP